MSYNNTAYLSPQIVAQVSLGSTNDTENSTTLDFPLHVVLSVQYVDEYIREIASWDIYNIDTVMVFNIVSRIHISILIIRNQLPTI